MSYLTQMVGPDRAELRVGGNGDGGAGGVDSWISSTKDNREARQLLGRSGAEHFVHPPASVGDPAVLALVVAIGSTADIFRNYKTTAVAQSKQLYDAASRCRS